MLEFEDFLTEINKLHNTIKFTASYDFESRSTSFLDTVITIENGLIITDLYRKTTDKVQYLLPTSCHPKEGVINVNSLFVITITPLYNGRYVDTF